jgi:hypothetical protein
MIRSRKTRLRATDSDLYSRVAAYAKVLFPCTLLLCAVVSVFLFKAHSAGKSVEA